MEGKTKGTRYVPGAASLNVLRRGSDFVQSAVDSPALSRRDLVIAASEAAFSSAALLTAFKMYSACVRRRSLEHANESERAAIKSIAKQVSSYTDIKYQDAERYLLTVRFHGDDAAGFDVPSESQYYKRKFPGIRFCTSESKYVAQFCNGIDGLSEFVRANSRYIVFADSVKRDLGFAEEKVGGIELGNGTAVISTELGHLDPILVPSRLKHEVTHLNYRSEQDRKGKPVFTLYTEMAAMYAESDILEWQLKHLKDGPKKEVLESRLTSARTEAENRLRTAEFLSSNRFGSSFVEVYPCSLITSRELLAAKVDAGSLATITSNKPTIRDMYEELYYASAASEFVLSMPRERAIRELYSTASNPNAGGLQVLNSLYALQYMAPGAMDIETMANENLRGDSIRVMPKGKSLSDLPKEKRYNELIYDRLNHVLAEFIIPSEALEKKNLHKHYDIIQLFPMYTAFGELPSLELLIANKSVR